jgi:putative glutamine amidotransferase
MPIRIAIPEPSSDPEYNQRSLPPYREALEAGGAIPVIIPLNLPQQRVAQMLAGVQGILLPGSRFDVDPERYGEERMPECGPADPARTAADELLLQDAFNLRKPILAVCHGAQTLNVWCNGTLVQDLKTQVNHSPGRQVTQAHPLQVTKDSQLARILTGPDLEELPEVQVNSSHHQAIRVTGDKLRVSAISPDDGVIEAVELAAPGHFALGVQWHPERTYQESESSRRIFAAFLKEAENWHAPAINDQATIDDSVSRA